MTPEERAALAQLADAFGHLGDALAQVAHATRAASAAFERAAGPLPVQPPANVIVKVGGRL